MRFPDGASAVSSLNHDRMAMIGPALQQGERHPALFVAYSRTIRRIELMRTTVTFIRIAQSWRTSPNRLSNRIEIGYVPRCITCIGGRRNSAQYSAATGRDDGPARPSGKLKSRIFYDGFPMTACKHAGLVDEVSMRTRKYTRKIPNVCSVANVSGSDRPSALTQ
jgi:hypothetical protein